jgi:hypothetical protein
MLYANAIGKNVTDVGGCERRSRLVDNAPKHNARNRESTAASTELSTQGRQAKAQSSA